MATQGSAPFHIRQVDADPASGQVTLFYHFAGSDRTPFVERIQLPPSRSPTPQDPDGFDAAARILLLVAGVSYYKSQAATEIVVEVPTTIAERSLVEAVYDHGLREFAYTNDLPLPLQQEFRWLGEPLEQVVANGWRHSDDVGRPLVPFGAGKDSTVVLSLLPEGTPVTVNGTTTHRAVAKVLGHDLVSIGRQVDRLDELTRPDRLNGHIPITAIVSAICVLLAARDGFTSVVMANEEAASEATLWSNGNPVNHQWSKGGQFEYLFSAALDAAGVEVLYFSWLRTVSEPEIVGLLSRQTDALPLLISCNRAFAGRTAGGDTEAEQRWCGECPKCLFTFLLLATDLDPSVLVPVFGKDLLDDADLTLGFAELWSDEKPFECVGERADAANAMLMVAKDPRWAGRTVPPELAASALAAITDSTATPVAAEEQAIPEAPTAFLQRMTDALGTLST